MELFQSDSTYKDKLNTAKDRIAAYMVGKIDESDLTEDDHEMMERWLYIWNLLNKYHTPSQAVESHIKNCATKGKEISRRTAYRDLRNATDLWGEAAQISKKAKLNLLYEFSMKTFQLAANSKNYSEMNKALNNLTKLAAMSDDSFGDDHEAHTYQLVINTGSGQKTFNLDEVGKMKKSDYHEVIEAVEEDEMSLDEMKMLIQRSRPDENKSDV